MFAQPSRGFYCITKPRLPGAKNLQLLPPEGLYPTGLGNRGYKLLPKSQEHHSRELWVELWGCFYITT